MRLETDRDVLELLNAFLPAAAFGAAVELGVFWELAQEPHTAAQAAERWNIPPQRCQHWLNLLAQWGLLDKHNDRYAVSPLTRSAILEKYTQDTWQFLVQRELEWYPIGTKLGKRIQAPGSLWELQGRTEPSDYDRLRNDPAWAERYTRMIYERSLGDANRFADRLDMRGVHRMMDLGGGSGVISLALLRRYPEVQSVVVDYEWVCAAAHQLAEANGLADRISFHAADVLNDELPSGFDLVIESDVGLYELELFHRVFASLNPGGRFVISQPWAEPDGTVPERLLLRNFRSSLHDPNALECVRADVRALLIDAGFENTYEWTFGTDDIVLESSKPNSAR